VALAKVTDTLDASLQGSGTLQARGLTVRQTDISVRGPGSGRWSDIEILSEDNGAVERIE
jgi:hypothetical protein